MVLLDMLVKQDIRPLVVAHVNHGMRAAADKDEQFVRDAAKRYRLKFEAVRLNLGKDASENDARKARYAFLRRLARKYRGPIITAHHADDVIETIALHLQRGTGWRGVAAMGASDVYRPLTAYFKDELIAYAKKHKLAWREDETNTSSKYARNRMRKKLQNMPKIQRLEVLALWRDQRQRAWQIDTEVAKLQTNQRYFYTMVSPAVAREVLRAVLLAAGVTRTRPQLDALVLACKVAREGAKYPLGTGRTMVFSKTDFTILPTSKK